MPIRTYKTDGITTIFDSDAVRGGICVGQYLIPAGTSFSKSFPLLQGATLRATVCLAYRNTYSSATVFATVDNTGVPTVTASAISSDRNILIWASGTPSVITGSGMQAVSGDQTIALSPSGRGLVYIGKATYTSQFPSTTGTVADIGFWRVQVSSQTQPIGIVDMSGGVAVTGFPAFRSVGTNLWEALICAVATPLSVTNVRTDLATPDVHCFALPAVATTAPKCALYDADATLAYDLLAGRMLSSKQFVSLAGADIVAALPAANIATTIPALGKVGLFGTPHYDRLMQQTTNSSRLFAGFWYVSGASLVFDQGIVTRDNDSGTVTAREISKGAFAEIIDLTGL